MKIRDLIVIGIILLAGVLFSCKKTTPMKWVDLRYLTEDNYILAAHSPKIINLKVKSTDPWEVYNKNSAWCKITPSEGAANEIYDVVVQYTENTGLDDRLDTLVIKSDYWIGRRVPVRQKGIAYLHTEGTEKLKIGQFGGKANFKILSNQDWHLSKSESTGWLEISDNSGHGDATISIDVHNENKGEIRFADIILFNRHNEKEGTIRVWQDGVVLLPKETRVKTNYNTQTIIVDVSSNTEWFVEKEDIDAGWIEIPQQEFNGDSKLKINLSENVGPTIRTGAILLKTKIEDGFEQVVKSIVVRQAYNPTPDYYDLDDSGLAKWIINSADNDKSSCKVVGSTLEIYGAQKIHRYNCAAGNWDFFMAKSSELANPVIYLQSGEFDMRWFVDAKSKKTNCMVVDKGNLKTFNDFNVPYSNLEAHKFGIKMEADKDGFAIFSWVLDDKVLGSYSTNGKDAQTSSLNFSKDLKFHIFVGAYEGGGTAKQTTVWSGWQYTLPYDFIDWGE